MILQVIVITLVQVFSVSSFCEHIYSRDGFNHSNTNYHRLNGYSGYVISNCVVEQLYNPTKQDHFYNLLDNQNDYSLYQMNTINIRIQRNYIANFSAKTFMTDKIACYYGRINLIVEESHVNHISEIPVEILRTSTFNNKVNGPICNVSYEIIKFTNNNITEVDPKMFNDIVNLTTIDLSNNNIKVFTTKQLNNLPKLKYLYLSKNNISNFDMLFGKLNNLQVLDLSSNNITSLAKNAFKNIGSLEKLDISFNKMTNIASGTFIYLNNLQSLDISHNFLTTIDIGSFSGLDNLMFLYLSHNHMVPSKYLMLHSPKLHTLDLSFNELHNLDLNIFNDHQLSEINIDGNKFSCQQLIHYINKFKTMQTQLQFGTEKDRLSLRGIHCNDTESNEDITINIENDANASNDFFKFFNQGFKESSFFKFFNNFAVNKNKAVDDGAYADAMKSLETSSRNIVGALNSTMDKMLMEMQAQNRNKDDDRKLADVDSDRAERTQLIQLFSNLQTELKRFDKSSDKLNELVSEKYVQSQVPADHALGVFNILIVIMCFISFIAIVLVLNLFWNSSVKWRPLNRNIVNIDDGVSRSEFCSMTDTL